MSYHKYPIVFSAVVLSLVCGFLSNQAEARIGESKEGLERRLLGSGAVIYRDDVIEEARRRGMPYVAYEPYLEGQVLHRIYFKSDDGRNPQSRELEEKRISRGWDLHVVYLSGRSKIEVYKRSQKMTPHELNLILDLQKGGSYWKKVEREEVEPSALGYTMERADGAVRARKLGEDAVLFFDAALDTELAETKESDLLERAPVSVQGF